MDESQESRLESMDNRIKLLASAIGELNKSNRAGGEAVGSLTSGLKDLISVVVNLENRVFELEKKVTG